MKGPFKLKYKNSAFPFKEDGNGYDPDEGYFQAMLKATQENPDPKSTSKEDIKAHQASLHERARQIQIIDYRKSQLKL
jgi:hypothetical protein|tara:strand:+ start:2837 stop:3070 length:234 start_codon:yes stop_codon:yes gene_type:complete